MSKSFLVSLSAIIFLGALGLLGCEQAQEAKVNVEKLSDFTPNLPSVPTIPTPPHPTQYPDGSYSVYGVRKMIRNTINTALSITGYVAKVYEPPPCPEDKRCPTPAAPHLWLADAADEQEETKLLLIAGYAENQTQLDEAVEAAMKGQPLEVAEGSDAPPIPVDLFKGAKVKFQGTFGYSTGGFGAAMRGFQHSDGVLAYSTHTIIQESPIAPAVKVKPGQMAAAEPME
jgi:hypothetical protein